MAAPRHGVCEAFLHFYFPQDVSDLSAISLETRSTRPGPFLKIGIQERPDSPVVFSHSFPSEGLGTEWIHGSARFRHLPRGWKPAHISTLHFVVLSNRTVPFRPSDTVIIRNIGFLRRGEPAVPEAMGEEQIT